MSKKRSFAEVGQRYERSAIVQKAIVSELIAYATMHFPDRFFSRKAHLDLGCGTGRSTQLLSLTFSDSTLLGLDRDPFFISYAKSQYASEKIKFQCCDFSLYAPAHSFDIAWAFSSLHWLSSQSVCIQDWILTLSIPVFSAAIFGPQTYCELASVLSEVLGKSIALPAAHFFSLTDWISFFRASYPVVFFKKTHYRHPFLSILELLKSIQDSQVRGGGIGLELSWTKGFLIELEKCYLHRYGQVWATSEVLFLTASYDGVG